MKPIAVMASSVVTCARFSSSIQPRRISHVPTNTVFDPYVPLWYSTVIQSPIYLY